jgi:transketolase
MRDTFVKTLITIAKHNRNVELITGDLGFGVLKPLWEECPNQFTNAGIAEQNMTSLAAGMALTGKIVFTYSIANFPTLRCLEQIRNDCAYHNANVKIVSIGAGFAYGALGMSHQSTEDIAIMRSLPNVSIFSPCDLLETEEVTKAIVNHQGTCYLRLGRGGEKYLHKKIDNFEIGKAIKIFDGKEVAIFVTGAIMEEVISAYHLLVEYNIFPTLYSFPTIKPIDNKTIETIALNHHLIVTVEEHNIVGGFGSAIAEVVSGMDKKTKVLRIGINDEYPIQVGNQNYLRTMYGLDSNSIKEKILEEIKTQ